MSGGSGTTITVTVNSAIGATVAQSALNEVSFQVDGGFVGFVTYTGAALPVPPLGQFDAVLVTGSASLPAFSMPNGYLDAVVNASIPVTFNDGFLPDQIVISGIGGVVMNNVSPNATIVLGGGANIVNEAYPGASASITLDGVGLFTDSSGSGSGSTFVNALANSVVVMGSATGLGSRTVNIDSGLVVVEGSSASPAPLQVNVENFGGVPGSLAYLPDGSNALIDLNGDTTVFGATAAFGNSGSGSETVQASGFFGGGKLTVSDGNGYFAGGSSGANLLISSTVPGAATLVGGNSGDLLLAQAAGDLLQAGAGSETLAGSGPGGDTFKGPLAATGFVNNGYADG